MKNRKVFNLKVSTSVRIADFTLDLFDLQQNFIVEADFSCDFIVRFDSEVDGYVEVVQVFDQEGNEVKLPSEYIEELEDLIAKHVDFYLEYQERQIERADFLYDSIRDK